MKAKRQEKNHSDFRKGFTNFTGVSNFLQQCTVLVSFFRF